MAFSSGISPKIRPRRELIRGEGRTPESVAYEQVVIDFFIEAADLLGVPKSLAAIYGLCFASPDPLSFSEIQERLAISSGSISQGLRVLREVGALKGIVSPTDRRERFEPDLELRKLVSHFIEERLQKQLDSGKGRLRAMGRVVPGGRSGSGKVLHERLSALQTWHDKARAVLPLVNTFLKLSR